MDFGPEISDLVVDYDPATLERRDVTMRSVLERLAAARMPARATRIARTLAGPELIDRAAVDGVLLRSHLELQRLHEEFGVGSTVYKLLVPVLELVRARVDGPVRIVDLGCGTG